MNDIQEGHDFRIDSIQSTEVKPGFTQLHVPERLNGKKILELFSGDDEHSLQTEIEKRGGTYTSVDLLQGTGDLSFKVDAAKPLPFLPDSFDYVLMVSPSVWQRGGIDISKVLDVLRHSLPVLKKEPGSFIGAIMHLDSENRDRLSDAIKKDPTFDNFTPWFEETSTPSRDIHGRLKSGHEWVFKLNVD